MGKPPDIFVVPSFELISPDDLHPAVLPSGRLENQEQPGGMVVALARALVEPALDRFLETPQGVCSSRTCPRQPRDDLVQTRCGRGHLFFDAVLTVGHSPQGWQCRRSRRSAAGP